MDDINVKGLSELASFMDTLAPKLQKNIMRQALRAGMKPIQDDAKNNVAVASGLLKNGLKISTRINGGTIKASLKATGKHAYLANWIEFGTAAHRISPKKAKALSIGGGFAASVEHPGSKAHAFLRPALDARAQDAVIATAEYIKDRLATKEGLDTSGVMIEGDAP